MSNAISPANFERTISNIVQMPRLVGGAANPDFMQPSGSQVISQQPEQRVGQMGFVLTF